MAQIRAAEIQRRYRWLGLSACLRGVARRFPRRSDGQPIWSLLVPGAQKHYSAHLSSVQVPEESGRRNGAFWGVDNSERVPIKGESLGQEKASQNFAPALHRRRNTYS